MVSNPNFQERKWDPQNDPSNIGCLLDPLQAIGPI